MKKRIIVVALGGNAITGSGSRSFESQYRAVSTAARAIAGLVRKGNRIVVTHGNGPQVGDALLRHEAARDTVLPLPLYACVAETQGLLGLMIQTSLSRQIVRTTGGKAKVVSLVSKSVVSGRDPAFRNPIKPVGPTCTRKEIDAVYGRNPSVIIKEIAPGMYRRVVPSPDPLSVMESDVVRDLVNRGYVVIAAGGGGVPVVQDGAAVKFVEAVVDKDLASERLATDIGASLLVNLTDVEGVYLHYRRGMDRKLLRKIHAGEMKGLLERGEFEEGSMEPKVRAAVRFVENTGKRAIVCNLGMIKEALAGKSGTVVIK